MGGRVGHVAGEGDDGRLAVLVDNADVRRFMNSSGWFKLKLDAGPNVPVG